MTVGVNAEQVTVAAVILGVVIHLIIVSFFYGRLTQAVKNTETAIAELKEKDEKQDVRIGKSEGQIIRIKTHVGISD